MNYRSVCHTHSSWFWAQYLGNIGSAFRPNCTNLLRNIEKRLNVSLDIAYSFSSWGSLHKRSAKSDARGHTRESNEFSSTCSLHIHTSPPRICWKGKKKKNQGMQGISWMYKKLAKTAKCIPASFAASSVALLAKACVCRPAATSCTANMQPLRLPSSSRNHSQDTTRRRATKWGHNRHLAAGSSPTTDFHPKPARQSSSWISMACLWGHSTKHLPF